MIQMRKLLFSHVFHSFSAVVEIVEKSPVYGIQFVFWIINNLPQFIAAVLFVVPYFYFSF